MKLYTENQVRTIIGKAQMLNWDDEFLFSEDYLISSETPIELPTDEEIEEAALKQFPYPIDIKDKNDEIIKTRGVKPFNHAKIEKYRRAFTIGAKYVCSKIQGDRQ